ncbi:MAG: TetR/AcrR family transcriptional regulator [Candidatus Ornithospirochaeta sp.]|nr:TetR/AcrR family transcriptional regulator [Sphaerochaetaceae bacterium]MDD7161215.1 TetR/AcrR family transcriptional regulator [Sphaerochaetaceae bacterium]MDY5524511.1 TetR/AcrR family transcriptional regulator [Candidatus Ornithospirochaeta sp.]
MPKIVDKEERMQMILSKALEVFAKVGYRESNLSLIAEACCLSRPTVYQYFSDKKEIYYYAVKNVTSRMFEKYSNIAFAPGDQDEIERLRMIVLDIFSFARENESTLSNLVEFILSEKKSGVDVYSSIRSRTAKMRILIKRLVLQGIHRNTIRECDADKVGEEIFSLVVAEAFQVGFFPSFSAEEASSIVSEFLEAFRR